MMYKVWIHDHISVSWLHICNILSTGVELSCLQVQLSFGHKRGLTILDLCLCFVYMAHIYSRHSLTGPMHGSYAYGVFAEALCAL